METILLVDDDAEQLTSLRIGLLRVGYNAVMAKNGQQALALLEDSQTPIDILITDYFMPEMNGIELLTTVKEKHSAISTIMMSAYGEKALVIKAIRCQCDSFIEKPFKLNELTGEIERVKHQKKSFRNSIAVKKALPRIVHQINNKLMAISGNAEIGLNRLSNRAFLQKKFESIIEFTKNIQAINEQIMNFDQPDEKNRI